MNKAHTHILYIFLIFCGFSPSVFALDDSQRREFLETYSPLILKEADEGSPKHYGHDWVLNFYFDGDSNFSNNSKNIFNLLGTVATNLVTANPTLRLNPTLYTYLIEFTENQKKSLIMVYNIYHARDDQSIHDWERFEIRLDNISSKPLTTETVEYGVITNHHTHVALAGDQIQFFKTNQGKHPLIFQAKWSNATFGLGKFRKNELHFVEDTMNKILTSKVAAVKVRTEKTPVPFHYLYILGSNLEGVSKLNAQVLTHATAGGLYSGISGKTVELNGTKRIQYELQDIADILPSHLEPASQNWIEGMPILMDESPIQNYDKSIAVEVSPNLYEFYSVAKSERSSDNPRSGYPKKHWFWGTYIFNGGNFTTEALNQPARHQANKKTIKLIFKGKPSLYFWQHDYYVHDKSGNGHWLDYGWHTQAREGFDGRWSQLFENN